MSYTTRQRWRSRLRSGGLEMHYQPLLCLRTGEVVKVEALARLRDAGKLMFPGDFFPVLLPEDFIEMYARGLEQALTHRADWLARGHDIGLSFNLPSSALVDSRYYDITEHVLEKHGCPAHVLTLELLETDEVPTSVDVLGELQRFRNLGVGLAEDDLGSGYSSLERLREMPFDIVKIDRSIVRRADQDMSNTLRFIYQLTRLGHSLGKNVVVEGIEDEGLLEAIAMLGADIVQGYVVSRPVDSPSLMEWLETYEPPAAPDRHAPRSFAAKLARLLVWEEHLHLLLEEQEAVQVEINRDLPFERVDVTVQRNLINAAKRYRIGSREYQRVRQQLVEVLAAER